MSNDFFFLLLLSRQFFTYPKKKIHSSRDKTDVSLYPKNIKIQNFICLGEKRFILINAHWIGEIYFRLERSRVDELFFFSFRKVQWIVGVFARNIKNRSRLQVAPAGIVSINISLEAAFDSLAKVFQRNFFQLKIAS